MFRLIPQMLIKNSRIVKGKNFINHEDAGNPITTSRIYNDQLADEIIILDIEATSNNKTPDFETLKKVSNNCFIPIAFGGGIKDLHTASTAFLNGADKIVLNSHIFENNSLIESISKVYGKQAVSCSLDYKKVKGNYFVFTKNGTLNTKITLQSAIEQIYRLGVGELILTNIDLEGTRSGPDIIYLDDLANKFSMPFVISGGVGSLDDFVKIGKSTNINAVAAGRVLTFSDFNLFKIRRFLLHNNIKTRLF